MPAAAMETLLRDGLPLDRLALAFEPLTDEPLVVPAAAARPDRARTAARRAARR